MTGVVDYSVGLRRVKDSLIQEYDQIVSELQQQIQLYKVKWVYSTLDLHVNC